MKPSDGTTTVRPTQALVLVRTWSPNRHDGHWAMARRVRSIRWQVRGVLRQLTPPNVTSDKGGTRAAVVTLTRLTPWALLDDDNLVGALKPVRDEVAAWLGIDDGDRRVHWRYRQRKSPTHGVACSVVPCAPRCNGPKDPVP